MFWKCKVVIWRNGQATGFAGESEHGVAQVLLRLYLTHLGYKCIAHRSQISCSENSSVRKTSVCSGRRMFA